MEKHFNTGNRYAAKKNAKHDSINIRVTSATKQKARQDAQKQDLSMAEWIARLINAQ